MTDEDRQFDAYMSVLDIQVPSAFRVGAVRCTQEIRQAVALLAVVQSPEDEPANTFFAKNIAEYYRARHG
ncbi:hypothetical protein ACQKDS_05845 [Serratia sp. NPDC078593]|uniref:hypothetical protein n=1 Tax=unclassified Serratia (in: enterobacteria) TaxID=2647522 RepID=UPI0037CF6E93